jgi:methionyl-tRNA formyltransferase
MKIIFFGTPEFAVTALNKLLSEKCHILAVVTAPDKPAGRGLQMQMSAVKAYCIANALPVLQPTNLKDENFIAALKELNADLHLVVAFRMLPEKIWNMPPMGTYNLHASLLPKYRGAAPINWCIINGDKESGVTTFKLQQQIDTGKILMWTKVEVDENMNAGELHDILMAVGADLLWETVQKIEQAMTSNTALNFMPQKEEEVSHAPKIFKTDCKIDWSKPVASIHNLIRGLSPFPAAYCFLNNGDDVLKQIKTFSGKTLDEVSELTNGSLITDNKNFMHVSCSGKLYEIKELQVEGKKRMDVSSFLKGFKLASSAKLE